MGAAVNLAGRRFGRLTPVMDVGTAGRTRLWRCSCDCGKTVNKRSSQLLQGRAASCGCLRADVARARVSLPAGESGFNALFRHYVAGAERRGLPFWLTREQFRALTSASCHYCGVAPGATSRIPKGSAGYTYNGVDRKNNRLGYDSENAVPCCRRCNFFKGSMDESEFLKTVSTIAIHRRLA
jgi:hypothetical protein